MNNTTKLYRLVPQAAPDDPNWHSALPQGEVLVRAFSPGDARVVAAEFAGDMQPAEATVPDALSKGNGSAFLSEALYTVIEDTAADDPGTEPRGVVSGRINRLTQETQA